MINWKMLLSINLVVFSLMFTIFSLSYLTKNGHPIAACFNFVLGFNLFFLSFAALLRSFD